MSWWSALVGGTLGFVIGGPIGAIIGAALGHMVGGGTDWARLAGTYDPGERIQTVFFTTTFSVMGHLAKADGRVSENEIEAARAVMGQMNLNAGQRDAAIRLFQQGKQPGFELEDVLAQFRRECQRRLDLFRVFVEIQLHAALSDGEIDAAERRVLETICAQLGISRAEFARLEQLTRAQHGGGWRQTSSGGARQANRVTLAQSYKVLGVSAEASDAEVKKAYRRLLHQHHPDKLVAKGLPEEMMKVAEQKTQQLIAAYERIKEARGMK
ncbi:MAG TPA: co-chaperone DjlA [Gammaproteobacteria bacterium]|nr:co-chaperone DjlA [Gammaproteobacteria bacterium]